MPTAIHHRAAGFARSRAWRAGLTGSLGRLLVFMALPIMLLAGSADAAGLRLLGVEPAGSAPAPTYPVPNDPGMIFYLQRSPNPNTVVYSANYDAAGRLDSNDPVDAFWRRFNSDGQVKKLSLIERRLAYGVGTSPRAGGGIEVRFRAVPNIPLLLEERGPGQAVLTITPQGEPVDLSYGFLQVDEGGLLPRVTGLTLFGRRQTDGQPVEITYGVTDGQIAG